MTRLIPESYINEVKRTSNANLSKDETYLNFALSFLEELGEVLGVLKKHIWHGHELNKQKLTEECGDVLWYFVALENCIFNSKYNNLINIYIYKTSDIKNLLSQLLNNNIENKQNTVNIILSVAAFYGIDLNEIIEYNINKLNKRYPNGFDKKKSVNRDNYFTDLIDDIKIRIFDLESCKHDANDSQLIGIDARIAELTSLIHRLSTDQLNDTLKNHGQNNNK